ncbi:MAG: tripartite tricarboxylate transporter substrate binding protein [Tropicimonas sp.]|uniref:tripartite tricarboxylate transporter substrate binding protein n=1 Tax=Tropicimonas sp. TaxID=2067044 RepID=UPI003A897EA5
MYQTGKAAQAARKLTSIVVATIFVAGSAVAQDGWKPEGPVELILHTKPGGGTDVFARTLSAALEPEIGQSLVIVNAPGGGGATQMSKIRAAKPDGLVLGANTVTHFTNMLTNLRGTFSPDDFSWIALAQLDSSMIFVRTESPLNNMADLVALARERNGDVNIGGFGPVGSFPNIAMTMLEEATGVTFNWVAFESSSDISAAVLGGHVDVGINNLGPVMELFNAGRLKGLGVLADERLASLPDMQTWAEQGIEADTSWQQVRGIYGPKGIAPELQQQIADAFHKAMQSESYQTYARAAGVQDGELGPVEYTAFVEQLMSVAETQLKAAGLIK